MSPIGEVRECAHCKGTGFCNGGTNSCKKCSNASGQTNYGNDRVLCSACDGKGSVWIGPNIVQVPWTDQNR
jgi:RecJ-like exonuclease